MALPAFELHVNGSISSRDLLASFNIDVRFTHLDEGSYYWLILSIMCIYSPLDRHVCSLQFWHFY